MSNFDHDKPDPFDVDAQHDNSHVHPVMRGVLADALQAVAPNYGRGAHHNAARAIVEHTENPPHGSPHDAGAKATDGPSAFNAEKFVSDRWPGFDDRFTPEARSVIVSLVDLAHAHGVLVARAEESKVLSDYHACVMKIICGPEKETRNV